MDVGTERLRAAWAVESVGKETSAPPSAADAPSAAVAAGEAGRPHPADDEEGPGWRVTGADHH